MGGSRNFPALACVCPARHLNLQRRIVMGRGILLWLLGIPIPIIILLALVWH